MEKITLNTTSIFSLVALEKKRFNLLKKYVDSDRDSFKKILCWVDEDDLDKVNLKLQWKTYPFMFDIIDDETKDQYLSLLSESIDEFNEAVKKSIEEKKNK